MMEKRFQSKSMEQLLKESADNNTPATEEEFPQGFKFFFNDRTHLVVKAWVDSGTQFREVQASDGHNEVLQVSTLRKDAATPGFVPLELTEQEKIMVKLLKAAQNSN
jgi:hypothetical protein